MPRPAQYVILWKEGGGGNGEQPDICQYASKSAAVEALETHGVENALCVVRGSLVEFGSKVSITDSAPRAKAAPAKKRGRKRVAEVLDDNGEGEGMATHETSAE